MDPTLNSALNLFIQKFLEIAIPILISALFAYGMVLAHRLSALMKEKLPAEVLSQIKAWSSVFVKAAEQEAIKNELEKYGESKKEWVLDQLQRKLAASKINLDLDTLSAIIEATVYEELTRNKIVPINIESLGLLEVKDADADTL